MKKQTPILMKSVLLTIMTVIMAFVLVPFAPKGVKVFANSPTPTIIHMDGDVLKIGDTEWTTDTYDHSTVLKLPAGNYQLEGDIVTTACILVDGEVTLDLNGYGIRYGGTDQGNLIRIEKNGNCIMNDSRPTEITHYITLTNGRGTSVSDTGTESDTCIKVTGGYLTGSNGNACVWLNVPEMDFCSFTMNGGTICGNTIAWYGYAAVYEQGSRGTFKMNGGEIRNNKCQGVFFTGKFEISGNPVIKNNMYVDPRTGDNRNPDRVANVVVYQSNTITVSGELTGNPEDIGVSIVKYKNSSYYIYQDGGIFTTGLENGGKDAFKKFKSDVSGNNIIMTGGEIALAEPNIYMESNKLTIGSVEWKPTDSHLDLMAGDYKLTSGIITTAPILVTGNVTIDLNGKSITYNSDTAGSVIKVGNNETSGSLILNDSSENNNGMIMHADTKTGRGVDVYNGKFIMNGGTITKNTCKETGAGVYVEPRGVFTMNGGSITQNNSSGYSGGGVYVYSSVFTMTGGSITNNDSGQGGGIFLEATARLDISGTVVIEGNTRNGNIVSNVMLGVNTTQGKRAVINVSDALANETSIGVTLYPDYGTGAFTTGLSANGKMNNFFSDLTSYTLALDDDGEAVLKPNIWIDGDALKIGSTPWVITESNVLELPAGDYKLASDIITYAPIAITGETTLDLNGYGIRYAGDDKACVIKIDNNYSGDQSLTLNDSRPAATKRYITLTDGRGATVSDNGIPSETCIEVSGGYITGGDNYPNGGGVYVMPYTDFTMNGGTIVGNKANSGGGVFDYGYTTGMFTMNGGLITNNTATIGSGGGGVFVEIYSSFNMYGGMILDNKAEKNGAGVYVTDRDTTTFSVSGNSVIKGNKNGTADNNVFLAGDKKITVAGELTNNASIGVTLATNHRGIITSGLSNGGNGAVSRFTSDNTAYSVGLDADGEAKIGIPVTVSGITAKDKTYDGTTDAELNFENVLIKDKNGDLVRGLSVRANGIFEDANASNDAKTVFIKNLTLLDDIDGVYVLAIDGQQTETNAKINMAYSQAATISANSITYDGTEKELISVDETTLVGGTMQYTIGEDDENAPMSGWSTAVPTEVNAVTYYVWYSVVGDDNHYGINPTLAAEVTIKKATKVANAPESAMTVGYTCNTVSMASLPEKWQWSENDKDKELKVETPLTVSANYIGEDKPNYTDEAKVVSVSITRSACTHQGGTATCCHKAVCEICGVEYGILDPDNHEGDTEIRNKKKATCTEDGYTGDVCCKSCNGKIESGEVDHAKGHEQGAAVSENSVPATCVSDGSYDEVVKCTKCGEILSTTHKTIKAHGHAYGTPSYEWSADGKQCTATVICTNDDCTDKTEGHSVTETATVTSKVKQDATTTEKGITTYTAAFKNKCFSTQTKDIADIPVKQNGSGNNGSGDSGSGGNGTSGNGTGGTGNDNGTGGNGTSGGSGTGNNETPGKQDQQVKVGDIVTDTVTGAKVKISSDKSGKETAEYVGLADKNAKSAVVPDTVTIGGKTYKITTVRAYAFKGSNATKITLGKYINKLSAKAFSGSKVKTIIVKTTKLTKKSVKNCLKGSKAKTITLKVKVGSKTKNKKYKKLYEKYFTAKNAGKKAKVK